MIEGGRKDWTLSQYSNFLRLLSVKKNCCVLLIHGSYLDSKEIYSFYYGLKFICKHMVCLRKMLLLAMMTSSIDEWNFIFS